MGMCKHCGKTTYLTHLHSCDIKPKEWQGLSDKEISKIDDECLGDWYVKKDAIKFAKAIEQKLKDKNS